MKTPMQEHIKWLKIERGRLESAGELGIALHIGDCIKHAESMLKKEEKVMCEFAEEYKSENDPYYRCDADELFNKTFKTKER